MAANEKRTIAVGENIRMYSLALVADAQAAAMRARDTVQRAADICKRAKQQRESVARAKSR